MARKGLFGRLAEAGRKWLERAFGGDGATKDTSQLAPDDGALEAQYERESMAASQQAKTTGQTEEDSQQRKVDETRDKLEPIISEANRRIELIKSQGLTSGAVLRAEQETGRDYFSLDELETIPELIKEATRARVFLADETSTIEGAKIYTAQLNAAEFRGQFGNQYHTFEHKFKNFNTAVIDEDVAKIVFSNYRKLEELRAADITGDGAYGSENLIIAMYDAQLHGEDSFMAGLEQLDSYYRKKTTEWRSRFERANEVTSILGTILHSNEDDDYLTERWF